MAGETGSGVLDEFPFGPTGALGFFVTGIARVVVAEVVAGDGDGSLRLLRRLCHGLFGGGEFLDVDGNVVETGCGFDGFEGDGDGGAFGDALRCQGLSGSRREVGGGEFPQVRVEDCGLEDGGALPGLGDVEGDGDVGRFGQGAELLPEEAEVGRIAGGRRGAVIGVEGVGTGRAAPAGGQAAVPSAVSLGHASQVAEVAVGDLALRLYVGGEAQDDGGGESETGKDRRLSSLEKLCCHGMVNSFERHRLSGWGAGIGLSAAL